MTKQSKQAQEKVAEVMHEFKEGTLYAGKDGKGGKVEDRAQAVAIALSMAEQEESKYPKKKGGGRSAAAKR